MKKKIAIFAIMALVSINVLLVKEINSAGINLSSLMINSAFGQSEYIDGEFLYECETVSIDWSCETSYCDNGMPIKECSGEVQCTTGSYGECEDGSAASVDFCDGTSVEIGGNVTFCN